MAQNQKQLQVKILKINETLFDGAANRLTVPGSNGEMTILPEHEPLVSILKKGTIEVEANGEVREFSIDQGYLETRPEQTSILLT
tara:strand:+ start:162 stop:416 length:255 start_codon:yes stop_codon:yes gene_type:complete